VRLHWGHKTNHESAVAGASFQLKLGLQEVTEFRSSAGLSRSIHSALMLIGKGQGLDLQELGITE
jgi:hypothetical protein